MVSYGQNGRRCCTANSTAGRVLKVTSILLPLQPRAWGTHLLIPQPSSPNQLPFQSHTTLYTPTEDSITMRSFAILATIAAATIGTTTGKFYKWYLQCGRAWLQGDGKLINMLLVLRGFFSR